MTMDVRLAANTARLVVVVHGQPAPQGSKKHVGHGVMVEASKRLPPWRQAITAATVEACQRQEFAPHPSAAYGLVAVFTLPRPGNHYRTGRNRHLVKAAAPSSPATQPDLDKLCRAALDGLADGGALTNDSRVVALAAEKAYPGGHLDALDSPGAVLVLTRIRTEAGT